MTKIEIEGDVFQIKRECSQEDACLNCYFYSIDCPMSNGWPYRDLCSDYDGKNSYAYFKRIK